METLVPTLFIGLGLFVGSAYFVMCHAIAVIARKTDQGESAEIMAYVPILQAVPMIWAGGGSVRRVLGFGAALLLANVLLAVAASKMDGGLATALAGFAAFLIAAASSIYMTVLACRTATARDLPGWFGLLTWLPGISIFVYPIMAFHDGWARPHRVGGLIGVIVMLAMLSPFVLLSRNFEDSEFPADLAEWASSAELESFEQLAAFEERRDDDGPESMGDTDGGADRPRPAEQTSIRVLLDLKERFESLAALARTNAPDDVAEALGLAQGLRLDLQAHRGDIDPETYARLTTHLIEIEAELHTRTGDPADSSRRAGTFRLAKASQDSNAGVLSPVPSKNPPASFTESEPLTNAPPVRPFPVEVTEGCPSHAELKTRVGDRGEEEWCQQTEAAGGLRHGWYVRYFEGGRPEQVGAYHDGLRVGTWTRFYPDGSVRAQAQFDAGLQHGWMLSFDEAGERQKAVRFDRGSVLR